MSAPRKLRELLGRWKPSSGALPSENAVDLIPIWPEIVGADVSRRTRPLQLREATLTILTVSSSWSHQLSFLAPAILERIRRQSPSLGVKRLRFVVATGRTRALLEGRIHGRASSTSTRASSGRPRSTSTPSARSTSTTAGSPAEDLDALLARLRGAQAALDRERAAAGWARCTSCGQLFERAGAQQLRCDACLDAERARIDGRLALALSRDPWLQWSDLEGHVLGAESGDFERVRRALAAKWQEHVRVAERRLRAGRLETGDRIIAWSYVMLVTGRARRDIGRALVENTLGSAWADALVEARGQSPKK